MPYDPLRSDYSPFENVALLAWGEGRGHFDKFLPRGDHLRHPALTTLVPAFCALDPITSSDVNAHLANIQNAINEAMVAGAQLDADLIRLHNVVARMSTALADA